METKKNVEMQRKIASLLVLSLASNYLKRLGGRLDMNEVFKDFIKGHPFPGPEEWHPSGDQVNASFDDFVLQLEEATERAVKEISKEHAKVVVSEIFGQ